MNWRLQQIRDLWQRATRALGVAERDLASGDPDFAAARAYYAAFYAASALLLADDAWRCPGMSLRAFAIRFTFPRFRGAWRCQRGRGP